MPDTNLKDLAAEINEEHHRGVAAAKFAVQSAIRVGELLELAKLQVDHGDWIPWVQKHCEFGPRQAQKYLRAYANRERIEAEMRIRNSHLDHSLDGMLALIQESQVGEDIPPSGTPSLLALQAGHGVAGEEPQPERYTRVSVEVSGEEPRRTTERAMVKYLDPQSPPPSASVFVYFDRPDECAQELYRKLHEGGRPCKLWRAFVAEVNRLDREGAPPH
jgi:hypothetical protein